MNGSNVLGSGATALVPSDPSDIDDPTVPRLVAIALRCHCDDSFRAFTFASQADDVPDRTIARTGDPFFPNGTFSSW